MHFFEIGSIYTFSKNEFLKIAKNRQIETCVSINCAFFSDGENGRDPGRSHCLGDKAVPG